MPLNRTPNFTCEQCGKQMWLNAYNLRIRRFCGFACMGLARRVAPGLTQTRVERFWSYVDKSAGEDACWLWTGTSDVHGYGFLTIDGRHMRATRIAALLAFGPLPEGKRVLHHCDNPPCVNPTHLYYGTMRDNTRDMVSRGRANFFGGRHLRGEDAGKAKLTSGQVIALRREYGVAPFNVSERARQIGITQTALRSAILGPNWRHLPSVEELRDAA